MKSGFYTIRRLFALIMVMMMVLSQGASISYAAGGSENTARQNVVNSDSAADESSDSHSSHGDAAPDATGPSGSHGSQSSQNSANASEEPGSQETTNASDAHGIRGSSGASDLTDSSGDSSGDPDQQDSSGDSSVDPDQQDASDAPGLLGSPGTPAQSGGYTIYVTPQGKGFADYDDMTVVVYDADGNKIASYDISNQDYGDPLDPWETKIITTSLENPAKIGISCSYHLESWGEDNRDRLSYEAPFEECGDTPANAEAVKQDPGAEVQFCTYSIDCNETGAPLKYVDAKGNQHTQEEYQIFKYGEDLEDGWYAVRGYHWGNGLDVTGKANLVLCDGSEIDFDGKKDGSEYGNSIWIRRGASLTIWCQKGGTGKIRVKGDTPGGSTGYSGNPGIDVHSESSLVINGGNITARGGRFSAGIGSNHGKSGSITINGGVVTAVGGHGDENIMPWEDFDLWRKYCGAGIGGGAQCENGPIVINGGKVTATAGQPNGYGAAGIGSGGGAKSGPITINGGTVKATGFNYGAGIGSGPRATSGPISINGGWVEATSTNGAGIGSGGWADTGNGNNSNGSITITGGTVIANSGSRESKYFGSGAAIGAGCRSAQGGTITITGGKVSAVTTRRSAAIGGSADDNDGYAGGRIIIEGENTDVTAVSVGGAAIGSGGRNTGANSISAKGASGGHITIDGATVLAVSTGAGAGIGGGNGGSGGKIEIYGGHVTAQGGNSKYNWKDESSGEQGGNQISSPFDEVTDFLAAETYDMIADAILSAIFDDTFAGSGIGGGSHGDGGEVHIYGGIVEASGGTNEAQAIGHGRSNGTTGTLTIYDEAKVTYGKWEGRNINKLGVATGPDKHTYAQNNSYAKIEPGDVTVTFDVNGLCAAPEEQVIQGEQTAVKPPQDPAADGYYFGGWYEDQSCTKLFDFSRKITSSTTVYARWLKARTLTVHKEWKNADTSELPDEVRVMYWTDNVANEDIEEGNGNYREIVLNADNNWTAAIPVSDESILTIAEPDVEGFRIEGYTVGDGIELPVNDRGNAVLNLRKQKESGMTQAEFDAVRNSVQSGNATLTISNMHERVYTVRKVWDLTEKQSNYRPDELKAALQHRENGEWKTVSTVTLSEKSQSQSGQNQGTGQDGQSPEVWIADFDAVDDDGKAPFEEWRIRELDKDGQIVLNTSDEDSAGDTGSSGEGGSEEPTVTLTATPYTDTELDMKYKVSYENGESEPVTTITNKSEGTVYAVKLRWVDYKGDEDPEVPESVKVELARKDDAVAVAYADVGGEKDWQWAFDGRLDDNKYVVREMTYGGDAGDYYETVNVAADPETGTMTGEAEYSVTSNGQTVRYQYEVTVETDEEKHLTTITNKKTGVIYSARAEWDVPEGSQWPEWIFRVYAVLQHRTTDESGAETWENVADSCKTVSTDMRWSCTFTAVTIDDNYNADDYRVREFVEHKYNPDDQEGFPGPYWRTFTYFDPDTGVGNMIDSAGTGRILLTEDDPGNSYHLAPVYYARSRNKTPTETTSFTVSYSSDKDGNTIMTNRQAGMLSVQKKWESDADKTPVPEKISVALQQKNGDKWDTVEIAELQESSGWKHSFEASKHAESGSYNEGDFRIRELTEAKGLSQGQPVLDPADSDYDSESSGESGEASAPEVKYTAKVGDKNAAVTYSVRYEQNGTDITITNTAVPEYINVEKKWDIDLENKDRPDSIEVAVQKKDGDKWKTIKVAELNDEEENSWKARVRVADITGTEGEYRVRELRQETALEELASEIREKIKSGASASYDEIIGKVKESKYYNALPDKIKTAADKGEAKLKKALGAKGDDMYEKLLEQLELASADGRIVYDKDDADKPKKDDNNSDGDDKEGDDSDGKDSEPETNTVTYYVGDYTSVLSGEEDGHRTRYQVTYGKKDSTYTITNKAVVEIDTIKRWITAGVDDDDMPDSVWLVLMCKPKADALDKAKDIPGAGNITGVLDYEFPVINPVKGGTDAVNLISQLTIGVDIGSLTKLAGSAIPKLAIAKTDEEGDWTVNVIDSKYHHGIPVEYKGAELTSEVIRQIIKYVTKGALNLPVSYNPFGGYFSIPTKAVKTILGTTKLEELTDISGLAGKAWDKAKSLNKEEIQSFGWNTFADDDHLMANVINVKIDWDSDDSDKLEGTKTWEGDSEDKRPEWLKIHIKDGDEEIEGSPVELKKEDFAGKNEWKWEIEPEEQDSDDDEEGAEDADEEHEYTVSEEFPEDFADKEHYTCMTDGLDITNTWSEEVPDTLTIYGRKIWKDYSDHDGIRPDSVTVELLANNVKVAEAQASEDGGWRYFFPEYPKKDESGKEIKYTVREVQTSVITGTDGPETYKSEVTGDVSNGLNIINTHTPAVRTINVTKVWEDDNDRDGIRPENVTIDLYADGKKVDTQIVTAENGDSTDGDNEGSGNTGSDSAGENAGGQNTWKCTFADKPVYTEGGSQQEITYSVRERQTGVITGNDEEGTYAVNVTGDADEGFTVTNTHTPNTLTLNGHKIWEDENNQDGKRPAKITINLYADGEKVDSKVVTGPARADTTGTNTVSDTADSGNWEWSFDNLPEYKEGEIGHKIRYTITEEEVPGYESEINGFNVVNTHEPEKISIDVTKVWDDDNNRDGKRPESITVNLLAGGEKINSQTVSADTDGKWECSFDDQPKYSDGEEIVYTVTEDTVTDYTSAEIKGDAKKGFTITNKYTPGKTQVNVSKVWNDDNDRDGIRPDSVTIKLLANGKDTGKVLDLNEAGKWTGTFTDLYVNEGGKKITYTVAEIRTDEITGQDSTGTEHSGADTSGTNSGSTGGEQSGTVASGTYRSEITGNAATGFTIINTHTPATTKVKVKKVWDDDNDRDGIRPTSVTVKLLADGKDTGRTLDLNAAGDWTGSFTDLYVNENGTSIIYTVEEIKTKVITGEDTPGGKKPEGAASDTNNDSAGEEQSGTKASGTYKSEITGDVGNGFTITNTHTPATTSINVEKVWDDDNNRDGKRPESITVNLLADGKKTDSKTVSAGDGGKWECSFDNLPKYNAGQEIVYAVTENAVDNYTSAEIAGNVEKGFTITNKYTPGRTQVNVSKVWADDNDRDGIRPDSVTVKLLANGEDTGKTLELNAVGKWTGTFTNLHINQNGRKIKYAIEEIRTDVITGQDSTGTDHSGANASGTNSDSTGEEQDVEEASGTYSYEISGDAETGFTITNTHTPATTAVNVEKIWDDDNDRDGKRPESVAVNLLADGVKTESKTVSAEIGGKWKCSFDNLPKYNAGKEIVYTVTEDAVDDYTCTKIEGDAEAGFTITNAHTPATTKIKVEKVWSDDNDRDRIRPDDVTVKLLANGRDTGKTLELNEAGKWTGVFTDLHVNERGKMITYTVDEIRTDVITGKDGTGEKLFGADTSGTYSSEITGNAETGFTITNTHTPATTKVNVEKIWDDDNNRDGKRPESITVNLLADGVKTDSKAVSADADGKWKCSFDNLPKNSYGKEVVYTITEDAVTDYTSAEIKGDAEKGFTITNKYTPGRTQVNVSKVWNDDNDRDGLRPESVTVRLLANGEDTGKTLELNEAGKWTGIFTDLHVNDSGKIITYTVDEIRTDVITGTNASGTYSTEITGNAETGFTITNTHTPEEKPQPEPEPEKPEPEQPDEPTAEQQYTIKYKLNGGSYNGSTEDITEQHKGGESITIHEEPVREGFEFLYWKGSEYYPGDTYTVTEDHVFTAQWKETEEIVPETDNDDPPEADTPEGGNPEKDNPEVKQTPATGDNNRAALWLIALVLAALELILLITLRRKIR